MPLLLAVLFCLGWAEVMIAGVLGSNIIACQAMALTTATCGRRQDQWSCPQAVTLPQADVLHLRLAQCRHLLQ